MDARKRQEAEFHDRLRTCCLEQRWSIEAEDSVRGNREWANFRWYSIERRSLEYMHEWLKEHCRGKRVLDYCCGNGAESLFLARHGAQEVIGIDISEQSIENCRRQAAAGGLEAIVSFEGMDAEATHFPDDSFDLATEYGALHHLDLRRALAELARIVKPDGAVLCAEVLAHNPLIRLYRRLTKHLRTEWEAEHILRRRDLLLAHEYFGHMETRFFHLATLAAVPFRRSAAFGSTLGILEAVDGLLLRLPGLKWQAWMVVFILSKPKKNSHG